MSCGSHLIVHSNFKEDRFFENSFRNNIIYIYTEILYDFLVNCFIIYCRALLIPALYIYNIFVYVLCTDCTNACEVCRYKLISTLIVSAKSNVWKGRNKKGFSYSYHNFTMETPLGDVLHNKTKKKMHNNETNLISFFYLPVSC